MFVRDGSRDRVPTQRIGSSYRYSVILRPVMVKALRVPLLWCHGVFRFIKFLGRVRLLLEHCASKILTTPRLTCKIGAFPLGIEKSFCGSCFSHIGGITSDA